MASGDEPTLNAADAELIGIAVARALQQARSVSDSEHWDHHRWITTRMEADKERAQLYRDLRGHLAKSGAWAVVAVIGTLIYMGVKEALKK